MYKDAIKIRNELCDEYNLDVAQSYYNEERLEKYCRSICNPYPKVEPHLKEFKVTDRACL